jgi:hypothetical protein
VGENRNSQHILPSDGETTISFLLRVNQPMKNVTHAINLYDQDHRLLWGNDFDVTLEPGLHEMRHTIPSLPLRPGVYTWRISIYEGGVPVDDWECVPQMHVVTVPITHSRDDSAGVLNIPSKLEIVPAASSK